MVRSVATARKTARPVEADVFDLQIGLGEVEIPLELKHQFDITGYLILDDLLTAAQVAEARQQLAALHHDSPPVVGPHGQEQLHVIEAGGVLEDAMALPPVLELVQEFIWGRQHRLIGSRALVTRADLPSRLTQGGQASEKRHARYRCFQDGQFRCLLISCLIALDDTRTGGSFCLIPGSHQANLPHPYAEVDLSRVPPLRPLSLASGSAVLFTESLSFAFAPPPHGQQQSWLLYQYGPSYMVSWPSCEPSAELRARTTADPVKAHLLLEPYYHPASSQQKRKTQ